MAIADEFRKNAERCRAEAENAAELGDRAFWLLLAESWQKLAQEPDVAQQEGGLDERIKASSAA